ncbi:hypothetical protein [Amycolatopsis sp. DG1A-15b]|uniref:hypothetical protein n=1 Tax=Amycolatopsis sp. DG1A-15b TaxID=3052846 RepID=UPI00255BD8BD|nr:hypothetical protein [Amycolatopsis sp. DG1A-15b]WIX92521.1 hypothetical protein QRY02_19610 [Amycolatopsis sp. DG1A-15b]
MSGITAATYVVEDSRERERREQRAAWADYAVQRAELTALRAEADGYRSVLGKAVAKVPSAGRLSRGASAADIRRAGDETRRMVAEHRERLRTSVVAAAREKALRSAPAATPAAGEVGEVLRRPAGRRVTARSVVDTAAERVAAEKSRALRETLAVRAAALSARLPLQAADDVRAACARAVEEITAAPSEARARLLLTDLATKVRKEEQREEEVVRAGATLAGMAARLDAIETAEAGALRAQIDAMIRQRSRTVPADLVAGVDAAVEQADRAVNRRMVAAAMRLSLDDLGYAVTEGFETVLADRGVAYASLPKRPGYGVKVLLDAGQDVVRTQVVRSDEAHEGGRTADVAAESSFCESYPLLLRRMQRNGVAAEAIATVPPGRNRLGTVAAIDLPAAEAYQQRSGHQAKEMGR